MSDLRNKVIKLAHDKPELRKHLLPLLKEGARKQASAIDRIQSEGVVKAVDSWAKNMLRNMREFYPDMQYALSTKYMKEGARYPPEIVVDFYEKGTNHRVDPTADQYVIDFDNNDPEWANVSHSSASEGRITYEREKEVYWNRVGDLISVLHRV